MKETAKNSLSALKLIVDKGFQNISENFDKLTSKVLVRKSVSVEEKYLCPNHADRHIKYFFAKPNPKDNYLFCPDCLPGIFNMNIMSSNQSDRDHYHKLADLVEYYNDEYNTIKQYYELKNINHVLLENFLERKQEIFNEMKQLIEEEKNKLASQIDKIIMLFTNEMNSLKEEVFSRYSTELTNFSHNLNHTYNHIKTFMDSLKGFDSIAQKQEALKKVNSISTTQELNNFIKETNVNLQILQTQLDSFNKAYHDHYKYAIHLIKRTYHHIRKPPKNIQTDLLEYNPDENQVQFLKKIMEKIYEPEFRAQLNLQNTIEDLTKSFLYEEFKTNPTESEPYQIDTLDYFYPSTSPSLQCLHYYDFDNRVLMLVNLEELSKPMAERTFDTPSLVFKISVPPEIKIPKRPKTLSAPDGSIYFIGGEGSNETFVFECKEKKSSKDSLSLLAINKTTSSDKTNKPLKSTIDVITQGTFSEKAKMHYPKSGHGVVYIGNGSIYSIAGFLHQKDQGYTAKCERYSIKDDKWTEIADCLYPASHPGVCAFDNKYIYKFGGYYEDKEGIPLSKIERYHIEKDYWTEIKYIPVEDNVEIFPKCFGLQINDNEIMILGGQERSFLFSQACQFLRINRTEVGKLPYSKSLTFEGFNEDSSFHGVEEDIENARDKMMPLSGRYVYQALIYEGKVYCLTVKIELEETVKNIQVFDGNSWSVLL